MSAVSRAPWTHVISKAEEERVMTIFRQTVNAGGTVSNPEKQAFRSIVTDLLPIAQEIRVPPWKILVVLRDRVGLE